MLKSLSIKNLTVFPKAELEFSKNLNVIVGENGFGKTHLLKLAYSILAVLAESGNTALSKSAMQVRIADKLVNVFRPEQLGRMTRRKPGRVRCEIAAKFDPQGDIQFRFATNSEKEVSIQNTPSSWSEKAPVYLPTRELLTIYPNFVSTYRNYYFEFEETWLDTCILLGKALKKGPVENKVKKLLEPIEVAMEGAITLDNNGRFYLSAKDGRMEMPLVAEGLRKLGMLARLIATGSLLDKGYLFWDEPEANLNPKLVKQVAASILALSSSGIQVFIATHSLFLLRELEILVSSPNNRNLHARYFGLHRGDDGVDVLSGSSVNDIGDITALDEELAQSDRFLEQSERFMEKQ